MKLAALKRKPIGCLLALSSSEPWDTVKAQILSTLNKMLSPVNINIDNYEISYVIPHIVTQALPLKSETDYGHMISKATKHNTDIKVTCIQKANKSYMNKENKRSNGENGAEDLKNKKGKSNIKDEHIGLSHKMQDMWAMAMLKGNETATLKMPPALCLFDSKKPSPVLQQCKATMDAQNFASSSSNSGLNMQTITKIVTILCPPVPTMAPYPYMQSQLALPSAAPASDMLLLSSHSVRLSM
ncbi:hypothetical protein PILCRDRAFT_3440 [Piloderma croceum F 1598]|uniref:Uncharacterized protein n=1 Tax=Piloderma croceum (strain F 1598) TaxID=765440 RepID=A0A0C3BPM0_PILCF|nr:hypothetical protein PILCRDRAFT_3440 [Piloderma croceum F 1598]